MAKGWQGIEEQSAALAAQREEMGKEFKPTLRLNDNNLGPFQIRFLEQGPDVNNFPRHPYSVPKSGGGGFNVRYFTCLSEVNQECPGCKAGMKVKRRGVYNVIQRNRPILRRDKDNKAIKINGEYIIDGYEDAVVIVDVGGPTAEMLRKADADYRGLMSRDFVVQYSGSTFQAWALAPVMDASGSSSPTPLSENDQRLMAQKFDLDEYMKPPSQQEAAQIIARYGSNSGAQQQSLYPGAAPAQATQMGVPTTASGGANGFLAQPVAPGGPPNAFGSIAPPSQQPAPPHATHAFVPPQQGVPAASAPVPVPAAPVPAPGPASAPAPVPAPAPVQQQ